jgi:AraC-like DNA-binding protein
MKVYREITPLQHSDIFVVLDSFNNSFDYPIHNHPELELNLVIGSSGARIVGDSSERYVHQDLVLTGPYLFHKWDGDEEHGHSRVITVQFRMDLFNSQFFEKSRFSKIRRLLLDASRGIHFFGKTFEEAARLMIELTEDGGFLNVVNFLQLLNLLACSKERNYLASEGFSPQATPSKGNRIQIAYAYILKNFRKKDIRIGGVAEQLNMSVSAFSHFFKKYTNKSFRQFLIDVRLGHACRLLLDTDQDVKEICFDSGFNNLANFNRLFKKYRSCTPLAFRRRAFEEMSFDWTKQHTPWQFVPSETSFDQDFKPSTYATTKVLHI